MGSRILDKSYDELRQHYLTTTEENLAEIENKILLLDREDVNHENILSEILRDVHSIKGSSGSYDFSFLSTVCHNFEDLITNSLSQPKEDIQKSLDIDKMLKFVDYGKEVIKHYFNNSGNLEYTKQKLNNLTLSTGPTAKLNKILLVESGQFLSRSIVLILQEEGYEIAMAHDGYEAFGRIINEEFDVLITSKFLESLDGPDLISCVKAINKPHFDLQTILITSDKETLESEDGNHDLMLKKSPSMIKDLISHLEKLESEASLVKSDNTEGIQRILFIDDDETIAPLVKFSLQKEGKPEIKFLTTGKNIIKEANEFNPDLIFLDYYLPDLNGPDVLYFLKQDKKHKDTPVIFLTGITNEKELKKIKELGVSAVISKPFRVKTLSQQVNDIWREVTNS